MDERQPLVARGYEKPKPKYARRGLVGHRGELKLSGSCEKGIALQSTKHHQRCQSATCSCACHKRGG